MKTRRWNKEEYTRYDDEIIYKTECNLRFWELKNPNETEFKFCPYCGVKIEEVKE